MQLLQGSGEKLASQIQGKAEPAAYSQNKQCQLEKKWLETN